MDGLLPASAKVFESVVSRFAQSAKECADRPALYSGEDYLTYGELDDLAARLAAALDAHGCTPGMAVGVLMPRGPVLLASMLAIFRLRAAYLPLDTVYPTDRLRRMVERSECAILVTAPDDLELAQAIAGTASIVNACLASSMPAPPTTFLDVQPGDAAYIIFTSGTTGGPKGAVLSHAALANHVNAKIADLSLCATDRVAQTASHCFDISLWQFLAALVVGGSIDILPSAVIVDPHRLSKTLHDRRITVIQFVPSLLRAYLVSTEGESTPQFDNLRCISTVGEPLPPDLCRKWLTHHPKVPILNHYGPTECGDGVTHHLVTQPPAVDETYVPIGRPIPGLRVYLVTPDSDPLKLASRGEVGELCVSGVGVAQGYINDPERTAAVFVANPFDDTPSHSRLYRTGDLARMRPDGLLECLGRADRQVKVRGYRVELAEIETVLNSHHGVMGSAVVLHRSQHRRAKLTAREKLGWESSYGNGAAVDADLVPPRLIAFVVLRDHCTLRDLQEHLGRYLAQYMLPDQIFEVPTLPLNANGKLDYGRLPVADGMRPLSDVAFVSPRSEIERRLAKLWEQILCVAPVGLDEAFIDLGGDSLRMMLLANRVHYLFGRQIQPGQLHRLTIRGLARKIEESAETQLPPIVRVSAAATKVVPPTGLQTHLWFLWKLDPQARNYTLRTVVNLDGPLDRSAFETAWTDLLHRFDTLRVRFLEKDGQPLMAFDAPLPRLEYQDLSPLPRMAQAEHIAAIQGRHNTRPFDLATGPLLRTTLVRRSEGRHELYLTTHEIIMDAWSLSVLARDLRLLYESHMVGRGADLPAQPEIGLGDYALWEARNLTPERYNVQRAYWQQMLSGELPVLKLPSDHERPRHLTYASHAQGLALDAGLTAALRRVAADSRSTLFATLLAGYAIVLGQHAGQDEVVVGAPHVVRQRPGTEQLLGFFLNMLPLRLKIDDAETFTMLVKSAQETVSGAISHADYPFSRMLESLNIERRSNISPVFQVMFNMYSEQPEEVHGDGGLTITVRELELGYAKYDLTLYAQEERDGIYLQLTYCKEIVQAPQAERILRNLEHTLKRCVAAPDAPLGSLGLLSENELRFLGSFNDTSRNFGCKATLRELFEAQVLRTPENIAFFWDGGRISYAELNDSVDRVVNGLAGLGAREGDRIAIATDRGIATLVAILACVKVHAAYVCLGPELPQARALRILRATSPKVMLTDNEVHASWTCYKNLPCEVVSLGSLSRTASIGELPRPVLPHDVLHIVFTSGTTGEPKGVRVPASACLNRLHWMWSELPFLVGDVAVVQKSATLVASSWEIFGPLLQGVPAYLLSREELVVPERLLSVLEKHKISHLLAAPPILDGLIMARAAGGRPASALRLVVSSTQALPADLAKRWTLAFPATDLFNFYGSTECSSNAAWHQVDHSLPIDARNVSIGRPLANVQLSVRGRKLQLLPRGALGELCVTGACLSLGYLENSEQSATRFDMTEDGQLLYRTGDLARFREDGTLELHGRADDQVKLNGYRVELDEVAHALRTHPAVSDAAVALHTMPKRGDVLVGYVVSTADLPDDAGLLAFIREILPPYMVPARIVRIDDLPRNPGGKLNRRALPMPTAMSGGRGRKPQTVTETALAQIWERLLGRTEVSAEDEFFALGGTSILSVRCVFDASRGGLRFTVGELYNHPRLADLACLIDAHKDAVPNETRLDRIKSENVAPPFSPTMRFISQHVGIGEHFNMYRLWKFNAGELNAALLSQAVARLSDEHPMLRTRLVRSDGIPERTLPTDDPLSLERITLPANSPEEWEQIVSERAEQAQYAFRFDGRTPLLRALLFEGGQPQTQRGWLFIIVHHFLTDGYGFRLLIGELERLYRTAAAGLEIKPTALTGHASIANWLNLLRNHVIDHAEEELGYWETRPWTALMPSGSPLALPAGPSGGAPTPSTPFGARRMHALLRAGKVDSDEFLRLGESEAWRLLSIPQAETAALLGLSDRAGIDGLDLILLALLRTLGGDRPVLGLYVDSIAALRTPVLGGVDLSSNLGFCCEFLPVPLVIDGTEGAMAQLRSVAAQRRGIPALGLGLRALEAFHPDERVAERAARLPTPRVLINFRAPLAAIGGHRFLELQEAPLWCGEDMGFNKHHWLEYTIDEINSCLRILQWHNHCRIDGSLATATAKNLQKNLTDVIRETCNTEQ
ncbi:Plipastatin synthase subunit C [Ensifer psoraleae]|uniref:non-ribosomal peptide synthetase n=1 Tax=Sinorhizobium psoraleae TaxID=520838 RepID=UPI0015683F03|nr:non-ribosomal peptide synthetase [Sinorhizobium psoraleae]NRP75826.1 Plipastatin synthase subunit C [Sinorhizobium psoraleae]